MSLDILTIRQDTPGADSVLHFNNAGTGLIPRPVLKAVTDHLELEAMIGGYEAHRDNNHLYNDTYTAIESLIGAEPGEIALAENATRAWDQVFYGMKLKPGDRVIADQASYASSYIAMLQRVKNDGIIIDAIPNDEYGQVDIQALEKSIRARTRLICATHVPTNSGLVNPAKEIGQVAKKHGIPYVLDACQSVGQVPVNVNDIGCDFLSATGRKYLRGPRGTGFLYVRTASIDLVEPPFLDLHAAVWTKMNEYEMRPDASRFENWEGYVAGKIGLGRAVRYLMDLGPNETFDRIAALASSLRSTLRAIPGIQVHDIGLVKGGIVTFSHQIKDSQSIKAALDREKINVQLSFPEWSRLDAETRGLPVMIRASVHYYNTDQEIDRFCNCIEKICTS